MGQSNFSPPANNCLFSTHTDSLFNLDIFNPKTAEQSAVIEANEEAAEATDENMIETISQLPFQLQHFPYNYQNHQQQRDVRCRHSPASPSPLGVRNVNAQSMIFPTMMNGRETAQENNKFREPSKQGSPHSLPFGNQSNTSTNDNAGSSSASGKIFSFTPANSNTVTPPPKQSTYETRFRRSGGSTNPFTKIFGSSSSPSNSTASASKHRQLFLNKVKQNRNDARFSTRGETLAMMEYHSEQQSWDEQMRRKAESIHHQYLPEEEDELADNNNGYGDLGNEEMVLDSEQSALEQFLMEEERDMYASLAEFRSPSSKSVQTNRSSFDGDDGDNYDDIFMELADNSECHQSADTAMLL